MATDGIKNENFAGRILCTETVTDAKGKKFTAYVIEARPPWFFGIQPHKVMRRYREFRKLKLDLVKTFGKDALKGWVCHACVRACVRYAATVAGGHLLSTLCVCVHMCMRCACRVACAN